MQNIQEFENRIEMILEKEDKTWLAARKYEKLLEPLCHHKNEKVREIADAIIRQVPRLREAVLNPDPRQRERTIDHIESCIKSAISVLSKHV